jgi:hypothetical protein
MGPNAEYLNVPEKEIELLSRYYNEVGSVNRKNV